MQDEPILPRDLTFVARGQRISRMGQTVRYIVVASRTERLPYILMCAQGNDPWRTVATAEHTTYLFHSVPVREWKTQSGALWWINRSVEEN